MKRLIDHAIFALLESTENTDNFETEFLTLKNAFNNFLSELLNFSVKEKDLVFCYRSLRELELKLSNLKIVISESCTFQTTEKQRIIRKLFAYTIIEKELFQLRIDRPEQFFFDQVKNFSVLKWKGSLNDLMELIIAFLGTNIIGTTTGENVTNSLLIQSFEKLFNVRFGRSNDKKGAVFRRKKNCACLLDRLKENLEMKVNDYYAK